jgi:hypothetical protein
MLKVLVCLHVKSLTSFRISMRLPLVARRHRGPRLHPPSPRVVLRKVVVPTLYPSRGRSRRRAGDVQRHQLPPTQTTRNTGSGGGRAPPRGRGREEHRRHALLPPRALRQPRRDRHEDTDRVIDRLQLDHGGVLVALSPGGRNVDRARRRRLRVPPVPVSFDRWRNCYVVARHYYRTCGKVSYHDVTDTWFHQDFHIGPGVLTLGSCGRPPKACRSRTSSGSTDRSARRRAGATNGAVRAAGPGVPRGVVVLGWLDRHGRPSWAREAIYVHARSKPGGNTCYSSRCAASI